MIVDAARSSRCRAVAALLVGRRGRDLPGRLKTELFASVVELNTTSVRHGA